MKKLITTFMTVVACASAQTPQAPNPTQQATENGAGSVPIYRITVVARTMKAINYNHRSGSTRIGFQGTALMPAARGDARVESKQGVKDRRRNAESGTGVGIRTGIPDLRDVGGNAGRPCN